MSLLQRRASRLSNWQVAKARVDTQAVAHVCMCLIEKLSALVEIEVGALFDTIAGFSAPAEAWRIMMRGARQPACAELCMLWCIKHALASGRLFVAASLGASVQAKQKHAHNRC